MGSQWGDGFYMTDESWAKSMNWLLQTMRSLNERKISYERKLTNKTAIFVLSRYISDIVKTGWLPVRQRRDFHVLKLVHRALHSLSWPSYVPLDTVKHLRSLRSRAATRLIIPMERGTFQDSAAKLFNALLANIRNYNDFKVYCREVNAYLLIINNICK